MNFFFRFVSALPGPFLGKYRDRRTETSPVPSGKDSSTPRKKLEYSPKRTGNGYGIATATIRIYALVSLDCHNRYPDLPIIPILNDP